MTDDKKTAAEKAIDIADASIQRIRGGMDIDHILHGLYEKGHTQGRADERERITSAVLEFVVACRGRVLTFSRPFSVQELVELFDGLEGEIKKLIGEGV